MNTKNVAVPKNLANFSDQRPNASATVESVVKTIGSVVIIPPVGTIPGINGLLFGCALFVIKSS